jgi:DNA-binding protein H-NS
MTSITKSYLELLAQRAQLEADIAAARATERRAALTQIRRIMEEHGITPVELDGMLRGGKRGPRASAVPKYRDPATGTTWSGRGRTPRWIAGQDREQYRITPDVAAPGE